MVIQLSRCIQSVATKRRPCMPTPSAAAAAAAARASAAAVAKPAPAEPPAAAADDGHGGECVARAVGLAPGQLLDRAARHRAPSSGARRPSHLHSTGAQQPRKE